MGYGRGNPSPCPINIRPSTYVSVVRIVVYFVISVVCCPNWCYLSVLMIQVNVPQSRTRGGGCSVRGQVNVSLYISC